MKANFIVFIIFLILGVSSALAQNVPNASGHTADPLTGVVTAPMELNQAPNTFPTRFNYVRKYTPLVPMKELPPFNSVSALPVIGSTTYEDGFGNPLMTLNHHSGDNDVIVPYDNRPRRTSVSYLPFVVGSYTKIVVPTFSNQRNFYSSLYGIEDNTAYSKTVSYSDQGLPTTKSYSPGKAFVGQGRGTTTTNSINDGGEVYIVTYSGGNLCKAGTYPAGRLLVNRTEGQHGQKSITYSDKSNRVLCKKAYAGVGQGTGGWLETYYVYNELGRLIYVIPPKASIQFATTTCLTNVNKLCYSYTYNEYGELISKTTPGKTDPDVIVYDKKHRPVMTQNALLKQANKFTFSIYDKQGRVVMSGLLNNAPYNYTAANWQTQINSGNVAIPIVSYFYNEYTAGYPYPTTITNCDIQTYNYYDSYNNPPANAVSFNNSFASAYLTDTQMITPAPYYFTKGKLVASKVKIIDNGVTNNFASPWITTVLFYDEQGKIIQTQVLNPWNTTQWDVSTVQYNFAGQPVLTIATHHSWNSANKDTVLVKTLNVYNRFTGKLEATKQQLDQQPWATIASYEYDYLGNVSRKVIGGVEEQKYTYNIRGQLTGINGANVSSSTLPGGVTFAEKLSYELNFTNRRYDGNATGFEWKTGSIAQSAYGYVYDDLGRMTAADYRNYSSGTWNKTTRDFSVSNIGYDANGNMLSMRQMGNNNSGTPGLIDNLTYTYDAGNQLQSVTDAGVASPLDDFNNSSSSTASYTYDNDGNLKTDNIKGLTLNYNFQDLPTDVTKTSGSIKNVYDATGGLIQKKIVEGANTTVYYYWGPFVYRNDSLMYVTHSEGRSRWLPDSNVFRHDYFVKDHLGNVRTVVTSDETPLTENYLATNEIVSAHIEEAIFSNLSEVRDVKPLGTPQDNQSELLNGSDANKQIGAAMILKVMRGDKINASVYSYHQGKNPNQDTYTQDWVMAESLFNVLAAGTGGYSGVESPADDNLLMNMYYEAYAGGFMGYNMYKYSATNPDHPRAYLNYLIFDQYANFIEAKVIQVSGEANSWERLELPADITAEFNGYVLLYISNEQAMDVWFDNLAITHTHGRLEEEQHYYPHGLVMSKSTSPSSKPENKYQYQGKEMQSDLGMQLYDFHARQYDPQIGRFWGIDLADQYPSGYTGMGNDPANMIDPSGMIAMTHNQYGQVHGGYIKMMLNRDRLLTEQWARQAGELTKYSLKAAMEQLEAHMTNSISHMSEFEERMREYEIKADYRTAKYLGRKLHDQLKSALLSKFRQLDKDAGFIFMLSDAVGLSETGDILVGDQISEYLKKKGVEYAGTYVGNANVVEGEYAGYGGTEEEPITASTGVIEWGLRGLGNFGASEMPALTGMITEVSVASLSAPLMAIVLAAMPSAAGAGSTITAQKAAMDKFELMLSKGGKKNIWPDQYPRVNPKDIDWTRGDQELADGVTGRGVPRGQGTPNNLIKKWFRDKRPK